jgi:hypothetical protein
MTQIYRYGLQRPPGRQDGHRGAAAIMEQPTLGPTDRPTNLRLHVRYRACGLVS